MALQLVHDSDKVETIPVGNLMDIAGMARRFADQVDAGEHGDLTRVMLVVQSDQGIGGLLWGENANSLEKMGMLQTLQMTIYASAVGDDD